MAGTGICRRPCGDNVRAALSLRGAKPRGNLHLRGDRFAALAMTMRGRRSPRPFGPRDDISPWIHALPLIWAVFCYIVEDDGAGIESGPGQGTHHARPGGSPE